MKFLAWLPAFSLAPIVSGASRGGLVPSSPRRRSSLAFLGPPSHSRSILKSDRHTCTDKFSSATEISAQQGGGNDRGSNDGDLPPEFIQNLLQAMMQNGGADGVISVDIDENGNVNVGGGGGGGFAGDTPTEEDSALAENSLASLRSFDLKPREVVEYLDRYVIQQRDAKRTLAENVHESETNGT